MRVKFFSLACDEIPEPILGVLKDLLEGKEVVYNYALFLVAFCNYAGLCRLSPSIKKFRERGGRLKAIVGIDQYVTTVEGLLGIKEICDESFIFTNIHPGHTFHPKAYIFQKGAHKDALVTILIGSSNLTLGGLCNNYEGNVRIDLNLHEQEDSSVYQEAKKLWVPFENAPSTMLQPITEDLISLLEAKKKILREKETRLVKPVLRPGKETDKLEVPFKGITLPPPPPIPKEVSMVSRQISRQKIPQTPREPVPALIPSFPYPQVTAYVMTLNPVDRPNIPGEVRCSKRAWELAPYFWGYPDNYVHKKGRKGERDYLEWHPKWRFVNLETRDEVEKDVRMYLYKEKAELRFYIGELRAMGAKGGDIIVLTRAEEDDTVDFICEFIPHSTGMKKLHGQYMAACTESMPNSPRKWGYI